MKKSDSKTNDDLTALLQDKGFVFQINKPTLRIQRILEFNKRVAVTPVLTFDYTTSKR
jgi:hypothetical protein